MSYPLWFGGDGLFRTPSETGVQFDVRDNCRGGDDARPTHTSESASAESGVIARIRAGDVAVFEQLFLELHSPLVRFATSYGVDADEADTIVVDVFVAVWDSRATWTPATSIAAYLFRAIRNRALNAVRDALTAHRHITAAAHELGAPLMGDASEPADCAIEAAERTVSLWDAITSLPERHRVLLTLRWRDGLSIDEIAAVLGISIGATKTGLTRAARALRTVLPADFR